jgi:hypothetical protein
MARTAIAVMGAICLSMIAMTPAIGVKCASIQAKCAVEAGGKCDPKTGHWCYGIYIGATASIKAKIAVVMERLSEHVWYVTVPHLIND